MATDALSPALHCSWGKYLVCHGVSLIRARFRLAQEAIWARAQVPRQPQTASSPAQSPRRARRQPALRSR